MLLTTIRNVLRNKKGQSLVEYGILVGAIAIVCLAATALLGHKINDLIGVSAALLPAAHDDDAGPVYSGTLVNTDNSSGSIRLSSVPGTFSGNLGITGADGLVVD